MKQPDEAQTRQQNSIADGSEAASDRGVVEPRKRRTDFERVLDSQLSERRKTLRFAHTVKRRRSARSKILVLLLIPLAIGLNVSPAGTGFWNNVSEAYRCSHIQAPASSHTRAVALIDQLASQYPDPSFVETVRSETVNAGLRFDYVAPNGATVDYFTNLPRYDYSLIILRVHGTIVGAPMLTTSQKYSQDEYVAQQLLDRVGAVNVNGTLYFGLAAPFVTYEMCGQFPGTMVLVMGCEGVAVTFGNALVNRGARALIGWDKVVTVGRTDSAFEQLVQLLLQENTVGSSVQNVMSRIGPDPQFGSSLSYYPQEAAGSKL
jgi:hypothetical protein